MALYNSMDIYIVLILINTCYAYWKTFGIYFFGSIFITSYIIVCKCIIFNDFSSSNIISYTLTILTRYVRT